MQGGPIEPYWTQLPQWRVSCQTARNATLAQLVERLIRNQQVAGSIPAGGSILFTHFSSISSALTAVQWFGCAHCCA